MGAAAAEDLPFSLGPSPFERAARSVFDTVEVEVGLDGEALFRRDIERVRGRHLRSVESEQNFTLALTAELGPRVDFALEVEGVWEIEATNETSDVHSAGYAKRGETWVRVRDLAGEDLALQVGRFEFKDRRGWWWDEDLDAVRLRWRRGPFTFALAGGTEIASDGTDQHSLPADREDVWRIFTEAAWRAGDALRAEAFFLHAFDRSPTERAGETVREADADSVDASLFWLGLRARGALHWARTGSLAFWIDTGASVGHQTFVEIDDVPDPQTGRVQVLGVRRVRTRGVAVDLGGTWTWDAPLRPRATAAFAWASGPRVRGGEVRRAGFAPTGLAGNSAPLGGVREFRYYGELLDPELANLAIVTAAVGVTPRERLSLDLLFHAYWQDEALDALAAIKSFTGPDAGIEAAPAGRTRYLGEGWDLVLGYVVPDLLELKVALSAFRAGAAFEAREGAWAWGAGAEIEFGWIPGW